MNPNVKAPAISHELIEWPLKEICYSSFYYAVVKFYVGCDAKIDLNFNKTSSW